MSAERTPGSANMEDSDGKGARTVRDSDRERPTSDESSGEVANNGNGDDDGGDGLEVVASHRSAPELTMSKARAIALVATVTGASFLNTLSGQAVVIILPSIGTDLSIPASRQQWIVSAYSLTFGCFLLFWGRIADLYGKRLIFILGSAWATLTLTINPFLRNEAAFSLFRGLQGLGAAANVPTAIGILGTTFPPGRAKNYAFSTYAAGAPLGSIFGNLLGGVIANYVNWTWVFWVLAILAALVTIAGIFVIPPPPTTLKAQGATITATVDWIGAFLITVGLMLLLFALTEGNVVGWSTPWVPVLIVVSVALIILFILWQHRLEKRGTAQTPLMKVSIFAHNRRFAAAMFIMALFFASFNGYLIFATYFFQDFQGLNPIQTTLRFLPTGIVGILTAAVCGKLIAVVPTNYLLAGGNAANALACMLFALPLPTSTSYFAFGLPAMVLSVVGADTAWPCLTLFTSHSLPQADQAMGGALVNAVGQVGRALGLAVATAVQTAVMAGRRGVAVEESGPLVVGDGPTLRGLRAAQWTNFGIGVAGFLVVLVAFRGTGIIGKKGLKSRGGREGEKKPGPEHEIERTDGEKGLVDQERGASKV